MTELKTSTKCFLEELIKSIAIHSQSRISKYKRPFIENIDANFGYYLDSLLESISQIDALEDKKLLNTEIIDATESLIIIQSYKPSNKWLNIASKIGSILINSISDIIKDNAPKCTSIAIHVFKELLDLIHSDAKD